MSGSQGEDGVSLAPDLQVSEGSDQLRSADHAISRPDDRIFLILALLLLLPALAPLFAPGYFFEAHDAYHTVFFLVEFDQAIRDGVLWPVWGPDLALGFGYPLWLLYAPLPYYVAEIFHLLGAGFITAVKLTWAAAFVLGAIGAYRLARRWWSPAAGLVAAVSFSYAPYHLAQIYVRGALAEFTALAWVPWALLAFDRLWSEPRPRRAALAALSFGALLLTHTVSTLLSAPIIGGYVVLRWIQAARGVQREGRRPAALQATLWSGVALTAGAGLAAIFLLPMLLERGYVAEAQWVSATYNFRQHFVYLNQFFDTRWGAGYSVPGAADGMSFQLGILPALGGVLCLVGLLQGGVRGQPAQPSFRSQGEMRLLLILVAGALFAMTPASAALWDALPLVDLVQFPWRFLTVIAVALALLSGAAADWLDRLASARSEGAALSGGFSCLWAIMLVAGSMAYVQPQLRAATLQDESPLAVIDFETRFPDMRGMTVWSEKLPTEADSPLVADYWKGEPLQRVAVVEGAGTVLSQHAAGASTTALVRANSHVRLRIFTYYFPGWRAWVDGVPVEIRPDPPNGLIGMDLPPGDHEVRVRFGATPTRSAGMATSGLTALILTGLLAWDRRRDRLAVPDRTAAST